MSNHILIGDALDKLKELDDNSIDLVCTDPPYGYSFMGKDWDKAVPSVEIWAECLRVLKPGAFCFVMSAPRSDVQMHMITNLTEAGFRLDFTPIYWTYASGFPKAGNIGKLVDKRLGAEREVTGEMVTSGSSFNKVKGFGVNTTKGGEATNSWDLTDKPQSDQAKALDGSYAGFQPKPAVEVIIVAMKPLSEKTFVDQALKNGKGITWLDDCRVPTDVELGRNNHVNPYGSELTWSVSKTPPQNNVGKAPQGRFPANLLVSDDVLNDGVERDNRRPTNDITSNKTIWDSGGSATKVRINDTGSYSRYFDLDKWATTLPFLIVPKASKSEKNKGLDGMPEVDPYERNSITKAYEGLGSKAGARKNHHPTVKPLKLMSYLITLGSREGDTVLDPFCGSGTTVLAAKNLKRIGVGIEREAEYAEIARARLDADKQEVLL